MATEEGSVGLKRKHVQDLSVAPSSEVVPHTPHPTKKPRKQTPKIRQYASVQTSKRPGKLRAILVMPREIRLEIFAHLSPLDLLNISRTNGQMRAFVTGSSALWKTVMNSYRIPPPPCPEGHSIVQWAAFLFDECCQLCLLHKKRKELFLHKSAYIRFCRPCAGKILVERPVSTPSDLGKLKSQDIDLDDLDYLCNVDDANRGPCLQAVELTKLSKKIASLGDDEKRRKDFLEEALACRDERYRVAETIDKWRNALHERTLTAAAVTQRERRNMIVAKLEAEGYELSEAVRDLFYRIGGYKVSKPLTDRQWTKIRPRFIKCIEESRQLKLNRLYPFLKDRFCLLRRQLDLIAEKGGSTGAPIPTILTVAKSPASRFLRVTPWYKEITAEEILLRLGVSLEAVSKEWKAAVDEQLRSLLPAYVTGSEGNGLDLLERATTWFKCLRCSEDAIHPSRILHHSCLRVGKHSAVGDSGNEGESRGEEGELVKDRDPFEGLEAEILASGRKMPTTEVVWGALISRSGPEQNMAFDDDSYRFSTAIIKLWEEDPLTVTYAWMSKAYHRPECGQTDCAQPFKCLFNCTEWYRAVSVASTLLRKGSPWARFSVSPNDTPHNRLSVPSAVDLSLALGKGVKVI